MIAEDKYSNALYALNGMLVHARRLCWEKDKQRELYTLLDWAEYIPRLFASDQDETEDLHQILAEVASECGCPFVLERFEGPKQTGW